MSELAEWWRKQTELEISATVPKAIEYGSRDLVDMGQEFAGLLGLQVTDAAAIELACYFYVRGKLARWAAAIRRNEPVSDDTIFDIGVYMKMVQRVRSAGSWPADSSMIDDEPKLADIVIEPKSSVIQFNSQSVVGDTGPEEVYYTDGGDLTITPVEGEFRDARSTFDERMVLEEVKNFLIDRGFRTINSLGELYSSQQDLMVARTWAGGEWEVSVWRQQDRTKRLSVRVSQQLLDKHGKQYVLDFADLISRGRHDEYDGPGVRH